MIDNYDSFTYNLVHLFEELGAEVVTRPRTTRSRVDEARAVAPDRLVVSPGPGRPEGAGVSIELIRALGPTVPTLGVCLGPPGDRGGVRRHGRPARALLHGKSSCDATTARASTRACPRRSRSGRYHSLAATSVPAGSRVTSQHGRRRGDGRPARRAADRGRPVPPGERAHPARAGDGEELPPMIVDPAIQLAARRAAPLARARRARLMGSIMDGEATPAQIAGFLVALRTKGETRRRDRRLRRGDARARASPVTPSGAPGRHRRHRRRRRPHVQHLHGGGARRRRGGSRRGEARQPRRQLACRLAPTCSRRSAFELEQPPERIARSIDELGFGFMFARAHHPAMRLVAPVRQEIGIRTVFNVLGPLANPAGARDGVFGVYSAALAAHLRRGARRARRAACVRRPRRARPRRALARAGRTSSSRSSTATCASWELDPRDLGLEPSRPGGAARRHRRGERGDDPRGARRGEPGAERDAVLLNAAGALVAAGLAEDLREGLAVGAEAIDSGAAAAGSTRLVAFSREAS